LYERDFILPEDLAGNTVVLPQYGIYQCTDAVYELLKQDPSVCILDRIFDNEVFLEVNRLKQLVIVINDSYQWDNRRVIPFHCGLEACYGVLSRKNAGLGMRHFLEVAKTLYNKT